MLANAILIAQLNIIFLLVFFLFWNKPAKTISPRNIIISLVVFNIFAILVFVITQFSYKTWIQSVNSVFSIIENWYRFMIPLLLILFMAIGLLVYQHLKSLSNTDNLKYFLIVCLLLLVAVGLWLPFGFELIAQQDNWGHKFFLVKGEWMDDLNKSKESFTRLSLLLTTTLAHIIDPSGFIGQNIIYMLFIFCKGVLVFGILKKCDLSDLFSLMIALLFMVYPTTTPVMSLRNFTVLSGIIMFLASIYTFLRYCKLPTRLNLLIFYVFMFVAITSHEYAFLHILFFPLLLLSIVKKWEQRIQFSTTWLLFPLWYLLRYFAILQYSTELPYGAELVQTDQNLIIRIVEFLIYTSYSFFDLIFGNWFTAVQQINIQFLPLTIIITVALSAIMFMMVKHNRQVSSPVEKASLPFVFLGTVIVILACMILVFTKRYDFEWRVYAIGSLGASLILLCTIKWVTFRFLSRHHSTFMIVVFGVLFFVAYAAMLANHNQEQIESDYRRNFFATPTELASVEDSSTWIYLFDIDTEQLLGMLGQLVQFDKYRTAGVKLFLGEGSIRETWLCNPSESFRFWQCTANSDGVWLKSTGVIIPYETVVFFQINEDGSTTLLEDFPYNYLGITDTVETYDPFKLVTLLP